MYYNYKDSYLGKIKNSSIMENSYTTELRVHLEEGSLQCGLVACVACLVAAQHARVPAAQPPQTAHQGAQRLGGGRKKKQNNK